jgi:hypothetical protein
MNRLLAFFLNVFVLGIFTSCSHFSQKSFQFDAQKPVSIRFQNLLSLQVGQAGCSIMNYGGLERMSRYSKGHPVDLSFQIGPAFSTIFNQSHSPAELREKREQIWKSWVEQGVSFYSVDAVDLRPSLVDFTSLQTKEISVLSSNLKSESGDWLFKPSLNLEMGGETFVVLSFSEGMETGAGWKTEGPEAALKELEASFPSNVSAFYVLGSLKAETRKRLLGLFKKPVLFLGGANGERNTTEIISLTNQAFWVKSPDLGRGYSEMIIGKVSEGFSQKQNLKTIGGLSHSFASRILREDSDHSNHCFHSLEKKGPQQK